MTGEDEHLSALWLSTLQELANRAAHDVRNALNGVAVNVEVVRSRAGRGAEGSAIAPFATAAAAQVEILSAQVDALMTLLRPASGAVDLGGLLGRLTALVQDTSGKEVIALDLPASSGAVASGAPAEATRLAVAAALLAALEQPGEVMCRLGTDRTPKVYISSSAGGVFVVAQDIIDTVMAAGIQLQSSPDGITLTFPPGSRD